MADLSGMEKKHTRNFSLDVHPYMLTIRKPKVEIAAAEPLPSEHNMDTVYLEGTHTIVHVSGAITGKTFQVLFSICIFFFFKCFNEQKIASTFLQSLVKSVGGMSLKKKTASKNILQMLPTAVVIFFFELAHKRHSKNEWNFFKLARLEHGV